jgi:hypothetical protein
VISHYTISKMISDSDVNNSEVNYVGGVSGSAELEESAAGTFTLGLRYPTAGRDQLQLPTADRQGPCVGRDMG